MLAPETSPEPPIRSSLLSSDQMERHGRTLAAAHKAGRGRGPDLLLTRLGQNEDVLSEASERLGAAVRAGQRIEPAGEWLLDNFYLIEEQIRTARRHLPKGYSRELPRLLSGPSADLPRVYDIALETIAHGDGRVDPESLYRVVAAYQSVTPLLLGELWAIPIMLRLALIENLRRVAARMMADRVDRQRAAYWGTEMAKTAESDPKSLILVIADMARSDPPMSSPFIAELARRLQGRGPALALPLDWIHQRLSESGRTIDQMVQAENQHQASDQVSISNSIGSLRFLGAMDWRAFVESLSIVEQTLREDPADAYGRMAFETRDRYRHTVERIAKRSRLSEAEVAAEAIRMARAAAGTNGTERTAHVGYYLVAPGLAQLERLAGVRPSRAEQPVPLAYYLAPIGLLTLLLAGWGVMQVAADPAGQPGWLVLLVGLLGLLAASQLAVSLANWAVTVLTRPRELPRMDFANGIPADARTLVVVPAMLTSPEHIDELCDALEVRYLANRDEHLHFGLLTDFIDATAETTPSDAELVERVRTRLLELNVLHAGEGVGSEGPFFLFHRPRRWNPRERRWMGYERKRGKLGDLNALIRTGSTEPFSLILGDVAVLSRVRYVITLDSDTQLPRDAGRELVATMAHPLNHPAYDDGAGRVVEGYGILQPRVSVRLESANRSWFSRIFGSEPGIDPYTRAVSDVYQDLFQEGSFIGKGIYEVEAFERALQNRLPENRILSHDLLEGCYARSGLLSDVELYEEFPSRYDTEMRRRHRWIRGDWQIARWIWPRVPGTDGSGRRNPLSALSRWKIFDNLRRSLVPAALLLLFLIGWIALSPLWWTAALLTVVLLPSLAAGLLDFGRKPRDLPWTLHVPVATRAAGRHLVQAGLGLVFLLHEAVVSLDAVLRTMGRMVLTRRRLLEWRVSKEGEQPGKFDPAALYRAMWSSPVLATAAGGLLGWVRPGALPVALPVLGLWIAAPLLAWWISRPKSRREPELLAQQVVFLHQVARRTWAFFERFMGPEDHWLPPDNFQEEPEPVVARRTSPTNIGLALLSNLAAYDFGYISTRELIDRIRGTLDTMERLERFRGHFYNWYDTASLVPMNPRYVSSVDSGNLAASLLTLRGGLLELAADRGDRAGRVLHGIRDTQLVLEAVAAGGAAAALARFREVLAAAQETREGIQTVALGADELRRAIESDPAASEQMQWWADALARQAAGALDDSEDVRAEELEYLAARATALVDFDYAFLYDPDRHLLSIGYNATEHRRDPGFYDLLASEARLASFVGIARGNLPQEHWFALGRLLTTGGGGEPLLLSWSGSMFEYLMPLLVMPTYDDTLLDRTYRAAVRRQIEYGRARGVPWGMSESGYNLLDAHRNYQYRGFGVPGLGLQRGLGKDVVVAPYASSLALMVAPEPACENLELLAGEGHLGRFGFYEAIDYTPSRLPSGRAYAVVRSFMAHHQGMSLLALAHALLDRPMQRRFQSDASVRATTLLLQERVPRAAAVYPHPAELAEAGPSLAEPAAAVRVVSTPDTAVPEVQLLSNSRYHVMITSGGGGYSRWKGLAVTRWRADPTRDNWGTFCYLKDVRSGAFWSAAHHPVLTTVDRSETILSESKAEFRTVKEGIEAHTEIAVSPEDDVEVRRVTLSNRSRTRRTLEITSYAEVVLAPPPADALHTSFSNLFVQTELMDDRQGILGTRRPRSRDDPEAWMCHLMKAHGVATEAVSYETDRMRFIGRGRSPASPAAMDRPGPLSGTAGPVLDPIVAIRIRITLEAEATATVNIATGVADSREKCLALLEKYQDRGLADRVFDLAWTHSQVVLRQLSITEVDAQLYARLAGSVLFANEWLRADPTVLATNRRGQSGLWSYAISGDLPIVLLRIGDTAHIALVRQLVQAHAYWRLKGLAVDLVIWNEDFSGYRQVLNDQIMGLIAAGTQVNVTDWSGGIFVRPADQISNEDGILLQSVASVILSDRRGTLASQIVARRVRDSRVPRLVPRRELQAEAPVFNPVPGRELIFFNDLGGFTPDGREYIITTSPNRTTPQPWSNVLTNPNFGTVISESGGAYTWSENAHELRLTPWYDDAVRDQSGEAIYLRDEETGLFWSPTPLPARGAAPYVTRHGFGYSVFEHTEHEIASELWVYVAMDSPVKFSVLKLRNLSDRSRTLSATAYVEWVLGDLAAKSAMHVITELDMVTGALLARNRYNASVGPRTAFLYSEGAGSVTADRTEFLGRNGTSEKPAALRRVRLSGRTGGGFDPCGAVQVPFTLAPGEERDVVFILGLGRDTDQARALVHRFRGTAASRVALEQVWEHWKRVLGTVQVETSDPGLNVMANGWLTYQALAGRFWARTGYYQSGGAFGFRDQLQDIMALLHAEPLLARQHLVRAAGRQFVEGDVQHWWHPPSGRGVRTRCSDDFLWLPLATARYVKTTGDVGVLDEPAPFLQGRPVLAAEDSYYDMPVLSGESAGLYEHCLRALRLGLRLGEHGLPLMGTGDWNDGMNLVGAGGRGESVWLGFFVYHVLLEWEGIARLRRDEDTASWCGAQAALLRENIERHAWDGGWYRRAWFDDGTPLGSAANEECQVDSISQSWSVLSGAGEPARARMAMEAVNRRLVRRDVGLVQLLDPPFDRSALEPGYIKGYLPGVRENGGQYTHAAIWVAMAFARLGETERAWEILRMINPVYRAATADKMSTYRAEPYVVSADVYAVPPHTGRGGWTWYTGSAGWLYRLIVESLLGIRLEVDKLVISPSLPPGWQPYTVRYRYRETWYNLTIRPDPKGPTTATVSLVDDHQEHTVEVPIAAA